MNTLDQQVIDSHQTVAVPSPWIFYACNEDHSMFIEVAGKRAARDNKTRRNIMATSLNVVVYGHCTVLDIDPEEALDTSPKKLKRKAEQYVRDLQSRGVKMYTGSRAWAKRMDVFCVNRNSLDS